MSLKRSSAAGLRSTFMRRIAPSQEAQAIGEIDSSFDPIDLAEFLLASWEGAILRMKVERSPAALDRFKDIVFETVFSKPNSRSR